MKIFFSAFDTIIIQLLSELKPRNKDLLLFNDFFPVVQLSSRKLSANWAFQILITQHKIL